ncbi:MAG: cytochrome c oxidase subunit II [Desulfobacula sp.]|jgi:cytochrome c oxidase subunit 2|uniref:cytochrome c oxidase subunit II n=1 Tax=Desulfobacula sp. TaxID=2593537 RepID=UPI001DCBCA55|nr:cytochrome c oxidase subunit II [Desulfobacula sp.]MBT3487504.1 cytochrome c oxidase subunit II [Desulfobacula sp.]MBT3807160.1 cytochrome c oxidase subunit II [Desulfobacula sp.]MBT4027381.1 cytochrome c oxidase subunit II [Desulfobacula sp.]MBT4201113.1 cytochrome c oxidase subunit II [Desulfobacula sp.]
MNDIVNPVTLVDRSFYFIVGFSFVFLFAITIVMIWFVIRYRRSKNPTPSDIRGNFFLEIVWIVIPTIIALLMFASGWKSYTGLRNVPEGALEIEVIGQSFSWLFYYPNEKETENEIVVPVNTPVKLNITSEDVIHSLFIPAFRVKVDAVKGLDTYAWFLPEKKGEYFFQCTEFCGTDHASMTGVVRVVSQEEYEEWVNKEDEW